MKIEEIQIDDVVIVLNPLKSNVYSSRVVCITKVLSCDDKEKEGLRVFYLSDNPGIVPEQVFEPFILGVLTQINGKPTILPINDEEVLTKVAEEDKTPSLPSETIENKRCGLIKCNQFNGLEKTSCSAIKCLNNLPSCASYRKYAMEAHKTRCMSTKCSNYATDELNNCSAWDDTTRCGEAKINKPKKEN